LSEEFLSGLLILLSLLMPSMRPVCSTARPTQATQGKGQFDVGMRRIFVRGLEMLNFERADGGHEWRLSGHRNNAFGSSGCAGALDYGCFAIPSRFQPRNSGAQQTFPYRPQSVPESPMSKPLIVAIPHRLGKEEAARRLKSGLGAVRSNWGHLFAIQEETWTGDRLQFQVSALGQSVSGSIDVREDHVNLVVFLPWLLAKLASAIQPLVQKEGTLMLEEK